VQEELCAWQVTSLFSPPRAPRYNGAIEAGVGSLKTRIETATARQGRPDVWTWDDVEAARREANATARPRGPTGPTPEELWRQRTPVTAAERSAFVRVVERYRAQEYRAVGATGPVWDRVWSQPQWAGEDRRAVRRALEACGYLYLARRPIALSIREQKVTEDS
jgi:hypothetical protein